MTTNAPASEQASTVNKSATFLGMTREIRDLIYHYVFPDIQLHRALIPASILEEMKRSEAAKAPITKAYGYLSAGKFGVAALIRQNFMISHQIRDEMLRAYYKQNLFSLVDYDNDLLRTTAWLQNLPLEQLKLMQNIQVEVYLDGDNLPLQWMKAEEDISQKRGCQLTLTLDFQDREERHFWILAYSKCLARRVAGATWDQIREQADVIHEEIEDQLNLDDHDDGYDSGSDGGYDSNQYSSDDDYEESTEEDWMDMEAIIASSLADLTAMLQR